MKRRFLPILFLFFLVFFPGLAAEKSFTIVIDPGHGGKDPGAIGVSAKEKDINLKVALKFGELIEDSHPDVKVLYTRKTDKFIELDQRARVANKAKADLFISIHSNAIKNKSFQGTETFSLGLARTEENLAVAKRENAAILLEADYKQTYEGFDPNSTDSYIIFEFMQNKFMEQSVAFASDIQKEFKSTAKRIDRGVKQAGFLVLRQTSMPSVLVELGFLTNGEEEKYLNSEGGQNKLSRSLYNAFVQYKKEHDRKMGVLSTATTTTATTKPDTASGTKGAKATETVTAEKKSSGDTVYKIQILISSTRLPETSSKFKKYKNVDFYVDKGIYKYTYGESTDFKEMDELRKKISADFKDAFVVTFKDGKRIK